MREQLAKAIAAAVKQAYDLEVSIELTRPDEQFGDYASNVALQLAQQTKQPPREVANKLAEQLRVSAAELVAEVSVAGPGFINLTLTDAALREQSLLTVYAQPYEKQPIAIETNNPNPFKAMHIGHAFNAILGDTLANLLVAGGADTHRVSYHGDVGAHVGKSMWALLKYVQGDASKLDAIPSAERNAFMSRMYAEGTAAYKDSEAVQREVAPLVELSFTLADPLYKQVYETCKAWSFDLLDDTLTRLGSQPVEKRYLESQADACGVAIAREHIGDVFTESDGAIIFEGEKYGVFTNIFVSSSGRGLYAARDLGLMELKQADYHPTKSYIVTAEEQRAYFKGVIVAAELCDPKLAGVTVNLSTGTVKLATGKMSSRDGKVLDIAWLFEQVEAAVKERGGQPTQEVVTGALRYAFLRVHLGGDIIFDVNEAVSLQGNSGPYLQYAHARARSILAKANGEVADPNPSSALQAEERTLVRKLSQYVEITDRAVADLQPHHICNYLYELAQVFNRFYEHNRVIGDDRQALRLSLVQQYADVLQTGLGLLGIAAPHTM